MIYLFIYFILKNMFTSIRWEMGSHFVGGYRIDFSPTEQETKNSILQAFEPR